LKGHPTTFSHTTLSDIGVNTHAQIDTHIASTSNPHSTTKAQVGLGNVDNTADTAKPVSTAQQTALDLKLEQTFETVSKNLKGYPAAFNYTTGTLTSIVYTLPVGTITKTLNYTSGILTSIVLSGDTPANIDLTKTLGYTGSELTSIGYS
jgi:hypothetical protein